MSLNDPLAAALSAMVNAEKVGKPVCLLKPYSRMIKQVLTILKEQNYIADFTEKEDASGGYVEVALNGRINKCGVIKPRFAVKLADYEKFEQRYLPAKDFGVLLVSTPKGILIHADAKEQHVGGRLLAYCY